MEKTTFKIFLQTDYTDNISGLRKICFPNDYESDNCSDEFDSKSEHIMIISNTILLGYGRLTPEPNAVFYHWSNGLAQLPYGSNSIDLGRCMVHPDFRRRNIMQLICISGLLVSKKKGFKYVNGAVVVGNDWISSLEKIGLIRSGPIVEGKNEPVNPLCCNFDNYAINFNHLFKNLCENFKLNNIFIEQNIF